MTSETLTDDLKESVVPYTNFRIALATAFLGSLGATLGWLIIVAFTALDRRAFLTAVIGAVVGLVVHWLQHYVRVALRERRGEVIAHHRPLAGVPWALVFSFLALAAEHLLSHTISDLLPPFVASLGSLIPAGAILGWTMSRGRNKDENILTIIGGGLFTGALIAVVTGIIWTVGFRSAPWLQLLGWWGAIGIGIRALTGTERNSVRLGDPIAAVALVFVASLLIRWLPLTESRYEKLGPLKGTVATIVFLAAEIQQSPGLPAKFWAAAEEELSTERTKEAAKELGKEPRKSDEASAARNPAPRQFDVPRPLTRDALDKAVADITGKSPSKTSAVDDGKPLLSIAEMESWLIILLFAMGAGFAPRLERELRPADYPSSETYKRDVWLTKAMGAVVVLACIAARFMPRA